MSAQDPSVTRETVVVATVRRAHALKGELFVHLQTDHPEEVFREGRRFRVSGGGPVGEAGFLTLTRARPHGRGWVLKFREIQGRTPAELYGGFHLSVAREELPALAEREYFLHDLAGLEVRDPEGRSLGRVEEIHDTAGSPLMSVRAEGGQRLVPLVSGIVAEVDLEERVIRVRPPPGLLDL